MTRAANDLCVPEAGARHLSVSAYPKPLFYRHIRASQRSLGIAFANAGFPGQPADCARDHRHAIQEWMVVRRPPTCRCGGKSGKSTNNLFPVNGARQGARASPDRATASSFLRVSRSGGVAASAQKPAAFRRHPRISILDSPASWIWSLNQAKWREQKASRIVTVRDPGWLRGDARVRRLSQVWSLPPFLRYAW